MTVYAFENGICMDLRGAAKEFDCTRYEKFRIFRLHRCGGRLLERLRVLLEHLQHLLERLSTILEHWHSLLEHLTDILEYSPNQKNHSHAKKHVLLVNIASNTCF